MKQIKDLLVKESMETVSDVSKLNMLLRMGLISPGKLTMVKRALSKQGEMLTQAERTATSELLDNLLDQIMGNPQIYSKVRSNLQAVHEELNGEELELLDEANLTAMSDFPKIDRLAKGDINQEFPNEKQIPPVLIMKRKGIRIYPDNQKVALYYIQALDKYVTIPFGNVLSVNEDKTEDNHGNYGKGHPDHNDLVISAINNFSQGVGHPVASPDNLHAFQKPFVRKMLGLASKHVKPEHAERVKKAVEWLGEEKLDELSQNKLLDYASAASADYVKQKKKVDASVDKKTGIIGDKEARLKRDNRSKGLTTAFKKVNENEVIAEVSKELATRAFVKRAGQVADYGDDDSLEGAKKRVQNAAKLDKQDVLMRKTHGARYKAGTENPVTGGELNHVRPWAGDDAWREAGAMAVQHIKNTKKAKQAVVNDTSRTKLANTRQKPGIDPIQGGWEGVGDLAVRGVVGVAKLAYKGVHKVGNKAWSSKPKPIAEGDIRARFQASRQQQLDENPLALIGGLARGVAAAAPRVGGLVSSATKTVGGAAKRLGGVVKRGAVKVSTAAAASALNQVRNNNPAPQGGDNDLGTPKSTVQAKEFSGDRMAGQGRSISGQRKTPTATQQGDFTSPTQNIAYRRSMVTAMNEQQITLLRKAVEHNVQETTLKAGEDTFKINNITAKKLLEVYDSVNKKNKTKMAEMLSESKESFEKIVNFANEYTKRF